MDDFERRHLLYTQYCTELNGFRTHGEQPMNMFEMYNHCEEYFKASECTWHDIHMDDQIIGFIVMANRVPYVHPECDYAICEAYIIPEYRRRGLMTQVVRSLVEEYPGQYCLLVLDGNEYAKKFWNKVFASMRYEPCDLDDSCVNGNGDCVCNFGFKPGGGS